MPSITDSTAEEFLYTLYNGTYDDLLKLYYTYKKCYNTGTADFVQRVVVQFFENYCIDITQRSPTVSTTHYRDSLNTYSTQPLYFPSTLYGSGGVYRHYRGPSSVFETFENTKAQNSRSDIDDVTDNMNDIFNSQYMYSTDITKLQKSSVIEDFSDLNVDYDNGDGKEYKTLEPVYACNRGQSNIPCVFETKLYFKNQKYFINIYSDPFISCTLVMQLLQHFHEILHGWTRQHMNSPNPWNFRLYSIRETNNVENVQVMIATAFTYNFTTRNYDVGDSRYNDTLDNIINDLNNNRYFFTMFLMSYYWIDNGVGDQDGHAVACGLIRQQGTVVGFILDSTGVIAPNARNPAMYQIHKKRHFFNEKVLTVLFERIEKTYPNTYTFVHDPDINLNPYNLNFGGGPYQEQYGFCVLFSIFFIHIIYNNICIHNRNIFNNVGNYTKITEFIKELTNYIQQLVQTDPFTINEFFYNYSVNLFNFFLSSRNINDYFDILDMNNTVTTTNAMITNTGNGGYFVPVTSANVMTLYMAMIDDGMKYLPSVIGVPKQLNFSNYIQMMSNGDFSCINFYTPFRTELNPNKQPLVSWSIRNKRTVFFGDQSLLVVDGDETLKSNNIIQDPSVVLLNLKAFIDELRNPNNNLITDFSLITPALIDYKLPQNNVCIF